MRQPADPDDPDVALVVAAYRAFARGDIDSAVASLHPDVEWIEPEEFPGGGHHVGQDAVASYLRDSRASWATLESITTPYRHGGDIVIVHHLAGMLVDGTPRSVEVADVLTVVDGAVVRMQAYADPSDAFAW